VKALKEATGDSDAWYYLGLSLHRAGEIKDARKAIEKAISLKPDFAPSDTAMAYMQLLSNDDKGAVKNAERRWRSIRRIMNRSISPVWLV
jgi:Flp pilus assembly protein TadD